MDATWGVVIVSVVGVLGTVAAAWITAWYSKKQTDAARAHEVDMGHREDLMAKASAFFAQIGVLDELAEQDGAADMASHFDRVQKAKRELRLLESSLAVVAPREVAASARSLIDIYAGDTWRPGPTQHLKDDLIQKLHAAVVESPWV